MKPVFCIVQFTPIHGGYVFLFEWGILMYLFLIIKLLSLLFMCVLFLYCVSFHTGNFLG
jgi:hypothetical protein